MKLAHTDHHLPALLNNFIQDNSVNAIAINRLMARKDGQRFHSQIHKVDYILKGSLK